ncbi:hypothetical protein INT47_003277 [Mucor saturninus]|uniref:DNA helicase n=1 Tax=Mucor saturninus TaxID=64648 RepID=A0A8H7V9B0_9FUNG|nr:hypothetical protein INT47_003277 [Mucor saturninus]
MKPGVLKFVQHLVSLVNKEMEVDKSATEKLLSGPADVLERKGVAILNLQVTEVKPGVGGSCNIVLEILSEKGRPMFIPQHKLTVGDIVALKEYDLYSSRLDDDELFWSGFVVQLSKTRVTLSVSEDSSPERQTDLPNIMGICKVVKLPNDITHERILKTLIRLQNDLTKGAKIVPELIKLVFGQRRLAEPKDMSSLVIKDESLNAYQQQAVRFTLGSPHLALIHGPPGVSHYLTHTGKTHTIIEIIRQLVEQKKKVLVCGPSNVAVDNILERYKNYDQKIVRIGHPARVGLKSVEYTLDVLCSNKNPKNLTTKIHKEMRVLSAKLRTAPKSEKRSLDASLKYLASLLKTKVTRKAQAKKIQDSNVIFSTLSGSGSAVMMYRKFDVVIIDEAAQATEPDCWVALTKARKAILAGDHLQLPPTVKSPPKSNRAANGQRYQGMSLMNDLSYTLFDRMLDMYGSKIKALLSVQYRMHEDIMSFSSRELYENKLTADKSVAKHLLHHLKNVNSSIHTTVPIIIIDTSDTPQSYEVKGGPLDKTSTANNYEVKVVISQIRKLLSNGVRPDQIAVITPYKAQVTKLKTEIGTKWTDIEIGTVDGFQGQEKEVIILSLVRSNRNGEVGFLADQRRLNVAMTRARRQLIVVCNTDTLNGSKFQEKKKGVYAIDRSFIEKWMVWLLKKTVVRASKNCIISR